jgi:uncharacterized protein YfiM (DUF2279 family)
MRFHFGMYLFLASSLAALAQKSESALPAPTPVHQVVFRHWPEQFVQWVGSELPYSMIELYVDTTAGSAPLYDAVLTERATGNRVHYSDQQAAVDSNKSTGAESYLTKMQFDRPANPGMNANYVLRFTDHRGAPVTWQFVQGSDIGERGNGLTPAAIQPPTLVYRERSAVAGQGTALKIGNVISPAEVWQEIAAPPYFIPYHGALTVDLDLAIFLNSGDQWTTVHAPAVLEVGAEWKLKAANGQDCTLKIAALQGDMATVTEESAGSVVTTEARLAGGVWSISKVHFGPSAPSSAKGMTVVFTPGLSAGAEKAKFEVFIGSKVHIGAGTASLDGKQNAIAWQFKDPDWLKAKPSKVAANQAGDH